MNDYTIVDFLKDGGELVDKLSLAFFEDINKQGLRIRMSFDAGGKPYYFTRLVPFRDVVSFGLDVIQPQILKHFIAEINGLLGSYRHHSSQITTMNTIERQVEIMQAQLSNFDSLLEKMQYMSEFFDKDPDFTKEARDIVRSNIIRSMK